MRLWAPQPELRIQWRLRSEVRRLLIAVGAATGAFGAITGFAVFILLREAAEEPAGAWLLGGSLFAAVLIAAAIEWLRDQIDRPPQHGHDRHNHIDHPPQQDHHRRKSFAAILVSIFLLVLFELSIVAYEEVYRSGMERSHVLVELGRKISGVDPKIGDALIVPSDLADSARLRSVLAREFNSSDSNTRCDAYSPDNAKHCVPARRILELMPQLDKWLLFRGMYSAPTAQQFEAAQKEWQERFGTPSSSPMYIPPAKDNPYEDATLADVANLPPSSDYAGFQESEGDPHPKLSLCLALNRVLADRRFYEPKYFFGVNIPSYLKGALEQSSNDLAGETVPKVRAFELNRRLLEKAFSQLIRPMEGNTDTWSNLVVLFALWLIAAAMLGATLAARIPDFAESKHRAAARSLAAGGSFAAVVVPVLVLLYVFVVRSIRELEFLSLTLTEQLEHEASWVRKVILKVVSAPFIAIHNLHPALVSIIMAILVAGPILLWDVKRVRNILLIPLGFVLLEFLMFEVETNIGYPFSLRGLATVALLGIVVWFAPSIFLGYSAPFLKPGASLPQLWGLIGSASGGVIVIITVVRLFWKGTRAADLQWILIGGLLILTGWLVSRGWAIEEYWPLAALAMALTITVLTSLSQRATFSGILQDAHDLNIRATGWIRDKQVLRNPHILDLISIPEIRAQEMALIASETKAISPLAMQLELCLMGSIGFWLTVGLLAGSSLVLNQQSVEQKYDGNTRCFWACPDLLTYHDKEHGVVPTTDRELYRRLLLDVLVRDRGLRQRDQYRKIVQNWRPERIARLSYQNVEKLLSQMGRLSFPDLQGTISHRLLRSSHDQHSVLEDFYTAKACVDTAKYFIAIYESAGKSGVDSKGTFVLDEWRARIAENRRDLKPFIKYMRTTFHVWRDASLLTFLQGIGLIDGAHFEDCRVKNNEASNVLPNGGNVEAGRSR